MKQTEHRPIEITYCDECGQEAGLPRYGIGDRDIGECCKHLWDAVISRDMLISRITEQPFYTGKRPRG